MNSGKDINYAAEIIKQNQVVGIPTETVYGLAANAYEADAIIKIYELKQRPHFNPLIVHIPDISFLQQITMHQPEVLLKLAEQFWPGPLTIIFNKKEVIPSLVTAGKKTVAVRIPSHPITLNLLKLLQLPLAAPSANIYGSISPTSAKHVIKNFGNKIQYVLDGGNCEIGIESTIIMLNDDEKFCILRHGGISEEQIKKVTGYTPDTFINPEKSISPGLSKSHYAPSIPLFIGSINELLKKHHEEKIAVIGFGKKYGDIRIIYQADLSSVSNLNEAAKNLFSTLQQADNSGADVILASLVTDAGIGKAINDRLQRAAYK